MITSSANRVQTGFRLEPIVLARVKEAARQQNISANEFVNRTLKEATQSIESEQDPLSPNRRGKSAGNTRRPFWMPHSGRGSVTNRKKRF